VQQLWQQSKQTDRENIEKEKNIAKRAVKLKTQGESLYFPPLPNS
jgi:hypothetical protein